MQKLLKKNPPRIDGEDSGLFFSLVRNLFRFVSSLFRQNEKQNTVYEPPCTAEDSDTSFESEEEVFYSCLDDDTAATYYDASDPDTSELRTVEV